MPLDDTIVVLDEIAEKYPLTSAGTLGDGSKIFFCFHISENEILNDKYEEYLVYLHSYKPGVANTVLYTPVRVVCQNTLVAALNSSTMKISVSHDKKVNVKTRASLLIAQAMKQADIIKKRLEQFSKIPLSPEIIDNVLSKTYDVYLPKLPKKAVEAAQDILPGEYYEAFRDDINQFKYVSNLKELAISLMEQNFVPPYNAYHLYQTIVECADHRNFQFSQGESFG